MHTALLRYRVMANVVGVLLILLVVIFWPMELFAAKGSSAHDLGERMTMILGITHGWLYMLFLVMAALLARVARWSIPFTITTLIAGTIPFVSFWAERRATRHTRRILAAEHQPA